MMKMSLRAACLSALMLAWLTPAWAQKPARAVSDAVPLDPAVRTGKLPNGFTYYIQRNTEPEKRVQLYLVIKAGSILEDDDQRGLAHYLEHMAFNGTKHFPKNTLIDYLQKSGVRFGADLNAYTSFDETVYQLPLPADDSVVLQNGFLIMRDWAQNALLDDDELAKERGVILEEKRMGKGVQNRIREKTLPVTFNHSRYADRLPIGTEDVLNNFTRERIAAFYQDWYRPDLEAIIVVGDISVDQTEKRIRALFADLKTPRKKKKRTDYTVPLAGRNQYLAVTDKEQPYTMIQLSIKREGQVAKTKADLRADLVASLFNGVAAERVSDLAKEESPSFLRAQVSVGGFVRNLDALSVNIIPKPNETETAFKTIYSELLRYKEYGVSEAALNRAKARYRAAKEAEYNERDKTPSSELVDRYVEHFTTGEATPGIEYENRFIKEVLPSITVEEVNTLFRQYFTNTNRDIILTAPEAGPLPDQNTVDTWIADVTAKKPQYLNETDDNLTLMVTKPVAGKIVGRQHDDRLGITTLTLSNGIKVVLKPTTFKNDEILIQGFSPGGTSLYNNRDYMSAVAAGDFIAASGVGPITATQLPKVLSGKNAGAKPFISERFEGIAASSGRADLETAFQLVYGYLTAPRKDSILYQSFIKRQIAALQNRANSPQNIFTDTINAVLGNNHYRRTAPSLDKINTIDLNRMYTIYRERFADAGDFTFVIVGSVTEAEIVPLLEQYVASLPAKGRKETAVDLGIRVPSGKIVKKVYKGQENKATVRLVFSGDHVYSQVNNLQLDGLKEVLLLRLTERLRESEGGVYSPNVSVTYAKYPTSTYAFHVVFDCAPDNVDKLVQATLDELAQLRKGVNAQDVQKYVAARKRAWQTMQSDNEFWYSFLVNVYLENESPDKALTYLAVLDKITAESLRQTAETYFNGKNKIEFVLLPGTDSNIK